MDPNISSLWEDCILSHACGNEKVDIVTLLLDRGANVNLEDNRGYVPLFDAINSTDVRILDNLIMHGANMYHRDKNGDNAWDHINWRNGEDLEGSYQRLADYDVPVSKKVYLEVKSHLFPFSREPCLSMMQKVIDKIGLYENDFEDDVVEESTSKNGDMEEE